MFNVRQHLHVPTVQLERIHIHEPRHLQHVHNVRRERTVNKRPVHASTAQMEHMRWKQVPRLA